MQFIDTVTIFHKGEQDVYDRKVIHGCYWYGNDSITIQENGIIHDNSINVFFPCSVIKEYELKVYKGDRIVKGDVPMIKSVNELSQYEHRITVLTVNENIVGSSLDNLVVTGK